MRHGWLAAACVCWWTVIVAGETPATEPANPHDHFIGWYELPVRQRENHKPIPGRSYFIAVLKQNDRYYTLCRGAEVPLKPIENGLEWAALPSSMKGTKFTFDQATKTYFITICDQQEANNNDWSMSGEKQEAQKVERPAWLPEIEDNAPAGNDDFVGCFLLLYQPGLRFTITREDGKFRSAGQWYRDGKWQNAEPVAGPPQEAIPLKNELGLLLHESRKQRSWIAYNRDSKRFEFRVGGENSAYLTMPLLRSSEEAPPPMPRNGRSEGIGIPSWH